MTIRAVIFGLLGAMFVGALIYVNDHIWMLHQLVASHFPIFVFGSLIAFVVFVNPVLFLLNRSWRLRPVELAFGMLLMLVACSLPGWGMLSTFTRAMVTPAQAYRTQPGWQKNDLRQYLTPDILPAEGLYEAEMTDSFMSGGRTEDVNLELADVPWHYWQGPLLRWLPLIVLLAVAMICLGLVVHRQWSQAERLRYPIADIATTLLAQDPDRATAPLFRTGMFWWGLGLVLFIRIFNGLNVWFPEDMVQIPMNLPFHSIAYKYASLRQDQWWFWWLGPNIYPAVIGIAFLLASEVSLSLGLGPPLWGLAVIFCLKTFDTNIGKEDYMLGGAGAYQRFGSYLAIVLVIAYTGRRYYMDVLKRALFLARSSPAPAYAGWACRIFLLAITGSILLIVGMGLPWPFAILFVLLLVVTFLGMSRINCESGLFLIVPRWQALAVLIGIFGATALGPQAILLISILCVVFTLAPWESVMPFFMNGLKMCTSYGIRPARAGGGAIGVYVLGLLVAVPIVLWGAHNYGVLREPSPWSSTYLPRYFYDATNKTINELKDEANLSHSESLTTNQRLSEGLVEFRTKVWDTVRVWDWNPDQFVLASGIGIALVLVVSFLRLRLPWWPIHPVMFMVWGTAQMAAISGSFLIGWLIKSVVTNLGGTQTYQRTKRLMFGFIAGDLLGGLLFMGVSFVYHMVTERPAHIVSIFPMWQ